MSRQNTSTREAESGETRDGSSLRGVRMRRNSSDSNLVPAACKAYLMNASKIHALRQSINAHNDNVTKILMTSKESSEKRNQIETAFRACKEAFLEISTAYLSRLEIEASTPSPTEELKLIINDSLSKISDSLLARVSNFAIPCGDVSRALGLRGYVWLAVPRSMFLKLLIL